MRVNLPCFSRSVTLSGRTGLFPPSNEVLILRPSEGPLAKEAVSTKSGYCSLQNSQGSRPAFSPSSVLGNSLAAAFFESRCLDGAGAPAAVGAGAAMVADGGSNAGGGGKGFGFSI